MTLKASQVAQRFFPDDFSDAQFYELCHKLREANVPDTPEGMEQAKKIAATILPTRTPIVSRTADEQVAKPEPPKVMLSAPEPPLPPQSRPLRFIPPVNPRPYSSELTINSDDCLSFGYERIKTDLAELELIFHHQLGRNPSSFNSMVDGRLVRYRVFGKNVHDLYVNGAVGFDYRHDTARLLVRPNPFAQLEWTEDLALRILAQTGGKDGEFQTDIGLITVKNTELVSIK